MPAVCLTVGRYGERTEEPLIGGVMYPMAEARGFEPCERVGLDNIPTDHEAALQRDASRHPKVYGPIRHESRPLRRRLAGSPRLSCPSSARPRTVNANARTKRCSRQRSPACAFADRSLYFITDRLVDVGAVPLASAEARPLARGAIPFLPTPEGEGLLGDFR